MQIGPHSSCLLLETQQKLTKSIYMWRMNSMILNYGFLSKKDLNWQFRTLDLVWRVLI